MIYRQWVISMKNYKFCDSNLSAHGGCDFIRLELKQSEINSHIGGEPGESTLILNTIITKADVVEFANRLKLIIKDK